MKSGIYRIECLESGRSYIGSAVDLQQRKGHHEFMLNRGRHHCRHLQNAWDKHGPECFRWHVLQLVPPAKLIEREQFWMYVYQVFEKGFNTRPRAHSNLGIKASPETCAKHSEYARNRPPELIAKIAASNRGKKRSPEIRARMAEIASSRSPEARAKQAASHRGHKHTEEAKAKMSAARKGKPKSEEWKAKIGAAHHGLKKKPRSAEGNAKHAESMRGKVHSEETKAKMAEARRLYWERKRQSDSA